MGLEMAARKKLMSKIKCVALVLVLLLTSCATTKLVESTGAWWTIDDFVIVGGFRQVGCVLLFGILIFPCLAWDAATLPLQFAFLQ